MTRECDRESQQESELRHGLDSLAVLFLLDEECGEAELASRLFHLGLQIDDESVQSLVRNGLICRCRAVASGDELYSVTQDGRRVRSGLIDIWSRKRRQLDGILSETQLSSTAAVLATERTALEAERREMELLRSDLLSTISHELRTPLTLVRTSIGLLLDNDPDLVMRDRLLRNIKQSADRMHSLVTDLLDLVRLRSGRTELQMRYVDVDELIDGVAGLMRPLMDRKEQKLEVHLLSPAVRVMGDHRRLEQVLLNLLSNANKFTPTGALVQISATENENTVTISVSDNGPGISTESRARLFEQFYTERTSSPSHNIGAGLGLPIAKSIVEAHGGAIWVVSEVGEGSVFYFSLPKEGPKKEEPLEYPGS